MKVLRALPFLLGLFVLTGCSFSLAADVTPPPGMPQSVAPQPQPQAISQAYPSTPPDPQAGKPIYEEKCAPCHGETGQGDGPNASQLPNPVAALGDPDFARGSTPAQWYSVVTQGNMERFMPPFASLTDPQRWDVVAYAFSLSAAPDAVAQGKDLYQANCARCHGDQGLGDGPDAAGLSKAPRSLADQAFMAEKSGNDLFKVISAGVAPDMSAFADKLPDDQRWALADYLRTLTFAAAGAPQAVAATPVPGETPSAQSAATPVISATQAITGTQTASDIGTVQGAVASPASVVLPAGLPVTLQGYDTMQVVYTQTTSLQSDGKFIFENVIMPAGRAFMAALEYAGTKYGSDISVVKAGVHTLDLPIQVYETTTDASALSADRLHLFFVLVDAKTLRIIELYVISNSGDKTVVPSATGQPAVTFKLPAGATNLEFQDGSLGGRYIQTADGFGDTASVRPGAGAYQVLFAYEMPYDRKLDLAQPISLPVGAVVILVPEGSIKVKSDLIQDDGVRDVQGTKYHTYSGGALKQGDELRMTITASSSAGGLGLSSGSSTSLVIGLGGFGLALILAGVWLFRRNRAISLAEGSEAAPQAAERSGGENAQTLMDAILALDDLFQEGKLPEEAYRQRRAALKARLKELMQ
jgi:mono/diheme cytochrome c family protein